MKVIFITYEGEEEQIECDGDITILDLARQHHINIEGACEGSLVCSTCHVILDESQYKDVCKEQPMSIEEEDMLDLAPHLTHTSRLGCQIKVKDGMIIRLPKGSRNIRVKPFVHH